MDLKQAREVLAKWDRRDLDGDYTSKIEALRAAVAEANKSHAECERLRAEVDRLRTRLEISPDHGYDGIACRDETIAQQDERINKLRAEVDRLTILASRLAFPRDADYG